MTYYRPLTQDLLDEIWSLHEHCLTLIDKTLNLKPRTTESVLGLGMKELWETQVFEPLSDDRALADFRAARARRRMLRRKMNDKGIG
jgi:hypothetical protein